MTIKANWPLFDVAVSFDSGPNSPMPAQHWCSLVSRTVGSARTARGKLYENDQVQTGTEEASFRNTDSALDPSNVSSPFYPNVKIYRAYRRRAQYPATKNLLTAAQAAPAVSGGLPQWVSQVGSAPAVQNATFGYIIQYPATPATGQGMSLYGWSVTPGAAHAASCAIIANANNGLQMQLQLQWLDVNGNVLSTTSGAAVTITTSYQNLTVAGTAPANAAGCLLLCVNANSPALATNADPTNFQVELNTASTAYVTPGTWYNILTGYVERWPQTWERNGTYGRTDVTCVDAFGVLSQQKIFSPIYEEITSLAASWLYPLDEPQGSMSFSDLTGNQLPLQTVQVFGGLKTQCQAGSQLQDTTTNPASFAPLGWGGPVVTFNNSSVFGAATAVIDLGARNPQNVAGPPSGTAWTRLLAFRCTALPSSTTQVWVVTDPSGGVENSYSLNIASNGALTYVGMKAGVAQFSLPLRTPILTNCWYLVALMMSADGKTASACAYAAADPTSTRFQTVSGSDMRPAFTLSARESLGGQVISNPVSLSQDGAGLQGDMALVAEIPSVITVPQWSRLSSVFQWCNASFGFGVSDATRYRDILTWGNWAGAHAEDMFSSGQTTVTGYAKELISAAYQSGTDVVTALQQVVDTESGTHYVAQDGTITFKARRARYNQVTPVVTFGENTAGGEIPYTVAGFDYDPSRVATDVALTQTSLGTSPSIINPTTGGNTGPVTRRTASSVIPTLGDITLQRQINTLSLYEIADAATFLMGRNSVPKQRMQEIVIRPSSFAGSLATSAWPALLAIELGSRVRVMRRPPGGAAITFDGFVEHIEWDWADKAECRLQISPAGGLQYWCVGSLRMTQNAATVAGATSAVLNALSDAATNPFGANVPAGDTGVGWVVDWGTPNAEYVQITTVPVTAPGYTTATVTIGTCLRADTLASSTGFWFAHAANALWQDIGGLQALSSTWPSGPGLATLTPANSLDQFCTVGSSTICGY